jgi:hypothetical protein
MNERLRMRRRSTRMTLANTVVLAQGLLLFVGCADDGVGPSATVPGAPGGTMTMTGPVGVAGMSGATTGPMAVAGRGSMGPTVAPVTGGAMSATPPNMTGAGGAMGPADPGAMPAQGGAMATDPGMPAGGASCLDGITGFDQDGPFTFMKEMSGMVHLWIPMVPAGCKVPLVHYANGTNSTCDPNFPILERLATHGFMGACFENPNTGAGTQAMTAYETAMADHGDMIDTKIGSTGHSQGGQAAFIALQLAEAKWGDQWTYAGLAVEPASGFGTQPSGGSWQSLYGMIKSPMFMFSGTADNLVSEGWVRQAYDAMPPENEVYWWSANGATHVPAPTSHQLQIMTPWFRWKLLGDPEACKAFKALPDTDEWDVRMESMDVPCE